MSRILAFAGQKGSGKSTLTNFLHGYQLKAHNKVHSFDITDQGKLIAEIPRADPESDRIYLEKGEMDITRLDMDFMFWAAEDVWPYIKHYAFATPLKEICIHLFGLPREGVYGSDAQKNGLSEYLWEDMPYVIKKFVSIPPDYNIYRDGISLNPDNIKPYRKTGPMTYREFIQYIGTEVFRTIRDDIWVARLMMDIQMEQPQVAVISDARFINEFEAIHSNGGKIIYLTRGESSDIHRSETEMVKYMDKFDATIDNVNLTIQDTCIKLLDIMDSWGWLGKSNQTQKRSDGYMAKIK